MGETDSIACVRDELERVREAAIRTHGIPLGMVENAARATLAAMRNDHGCAGVMLRLRARRYFWAVVRRQARKGGSPDVSARFVLQAVVDDLTAAGREPRAVWEQLDRDWSSRFPAEVLAEYERRLCA